MFLELDPQKSPDDDDWLNPYLEMWMSFLFIPFFFARFSFLNDNFSKNMHTSRLPIEKFWYEWMQFKQQQKQLALISSNRKDWYSKQNP